MVEKKKESIASLEMQVEELKDERRLHEGKAGKGNSGCGPVLIVIGAILIIFIEPITGFLALIAGVLIVAFMSGGKEAKEKVEEIDKKIKKLRTQIVELKEQQP